MAERAPADMTPVEIDTILAELWEKIDRTRTNLDATRRRAARLPRLAADVARLDDELAGLHAAAAPYEAEWVRRRWHRYFLVTNHGGHVHRDMNCATCRPTTRYRWIVDLAGCDEAEMVAEFGETACTVCFPDAPTHPGFAGPGRRDREAAAARAAERDARAAAKAAKNLTADEVFRDVDDWPVRTVAAAKTALRRCAEVTALADAGGDPHHRMLSVRAADVEATARRVLGARGMTDDELDVLWDRATRKARKEWGLA